LFPVQLPKIKLEPTEEFDEQGAVLWRAYDVRRDGIERHEA
jgi:hypothetical protein